MHMQLRPLLLATLLAVSGTTAGAAAQGLPSEPVSLGGGRVVLGAEASATVASEDPGFFNYTDYEYSAIRNLRIGLTAQVRASERFQVLGELRLDHGDSLQPFALYARIRPWPRRRLDIQVGRIPPTFGALGRGSYGSANMLIGTPLAYQYLTSLRTDALPERADDLVRMRGRGWLSEFPLGNRTPDRGLPLINSYRWDTGVQIHGVNGIVEWTGALTTGSLSNPRVDDDNSGRQLAGRAVVRPAAAVALGVSAARGAYLDRSVATVLGDRSIEEGVQYAVGADVEYSVGRFLTRSEVIRNVWRVPVAAEAAGALTLPATSLLVEARYRLLPGVQVGARAERLAFGRIAASEGLVPWEARVRRFEAGVGWSILRNVMVKGSWQHHDRDGGRVRRDSLAALQVVYWF
jgi:hypothetical protein